MSENRLDLVATPGGREIVITRVFDAPRELVFKAMTDPDRIPEWWGPSEYTTTVVEMDVRPGGRWRFVQHDKAGNEFGFHGEYREVLPSERLVQTFEFEGMPGHVSVDTATFEELADGRTKFTGVSVYDNVEDRDGMLQSGAEAGMRETYERLDALLESIRTREQAAERKAA